MTDSPIPGSPYTSPVGGAPTGPDSSASVEETRRKLEETLDEIEEKLDVKKRASEIGDRIERSYAENPVPWIIGATTVAVGIIGLVAWAIFSDD